MTEEAVQDVVSQICVIAHQLDMPDLAGYASLRLSGDISEGHLIVELLKVLVDKAYGQDGGNQSVADRLGLRYLPMFLETLKFHGGDTVMRLISATGLGKKSDRTPKSVCLATNLVAASSEWATRTQKCKHIDSGEVGIHIQAALDMMVEVAEGTAGDVACKLTDCDDGGKVCVFLTTNSLDDLLIATGATPHKGNIVGFKKPVTKEGLEKLRGLAAA